MPTLLVLGTLGCVYPMQVQHNRISIPQPYRSVVVAAPTGPVHVTGRDGAATEIDTTIRWHGGAPEVRVDVVDGELRVVVECPSPLVYCAADLDLRVPDSVGVRVDTDAGEVHLTGLTGPLQVHTDFGSILVDHADGPLDLVTGTGSIVGTDLGPSDVTARTTLGSVTLGFAAPPARVSVNVGAGGIDLSVPTGVYDLRTRGLGELAVSGITSTTGSGAVVDLATGLGSIHVRGTAVAPVEEGPLAIPGDGT